MKFVNALLGIGQLIGSVVLILGYIFNDQIWNLVLQFDIQISYETFVDIYLLAIGGILVSIPVKFILEKIVNAKFLL